MKKGASVSPAEPPWPNATRKWAALRPALLSELKHLNLPASPIVAIAASSAANGDLVTAVANVVLVIEAASADPVIEPLIAHLVETEAATVAETAVGTVPGGTKALTARAPSKAATALIATAQIKAAATNPIAPSRVTSGLNVPVAMRAVIDLSANALTRAATNPLVQKKVTSGLSANPIARHPTRNS